MYKSYVRTNLVKNVPPIVDALVSRTTAAQA
jgi:hypothetical protein